MRTGIGFDTHRLVEGRRLILGGVAIPHPVGLLGHSDADVLTHALMDALLGAIADGDIGQHFPDTDPQWAGADSLALLRAVVARLAAQGWRPANVDATVLAERPKLRRHRPPRRHLRPRRRHRRAPPLTPAHHFPKKVRHLSFLAPYNPNDVHCVDGARKEMT